jgi:predicted RNA binding protein YcfA (HicA-like mRNA interferase family)
MKQGKDKQIIPNPHGKDISSVLIKEMLKQSGISVEEWLDA